MKILIDMIVHIFGQDKADEIHLYRGCSVVWNTWEAVIRFSMYCPRTWKHILKTLVTHTLNQMFIYLIFWSEPQVLLLDVVHLAAEVLQRVLQLQHLADQPRLLLQVINWVLLKSCWCHLNVIMICWIVPDSSPCLCVVVVWWLTVIRCSRSRCSHSPAALCRCCWELQFQVKTTRTHSAVTHKQGSLYRLQDTLATIDKINKRYPGKNFLVTKLWKIKNEKNIMWL